MQNPPITVRHSMDSEFFYEREAEYYGFTPFQLLDKIGEIVVKSVYSMFDRTATSVLSPQLPFLSVGQIEAGVGQWAALVESRFSRNYELFESYVIKNVILVPDSFILPHYSDILSAEGCPSTDDSEIEPLLLRLQEARIQEAQLESEERMIREQEAILEKMEEQLDLLKERLSNHKAGSFEQMAASLVAGVEQLQIIVNDTIDKSRVLPTIGSDDSSEEVILEQWNLAKCSSSSEGDDSLRSNLSDLELELARCAKIASFDHLNSLKFLL